MKKIIATIILILISAAILGLAIRGKAGNPSEDELNTLEWRENGPFELSPERGRFALTYALVENKSFKYSLPLARFISPDVGYHNREYVSLFAPGVSFLIIPGYVLGRILSLSQIGSYAVIAFFALMNALLIRSIAVSLKINSAASTLASLLFLFASPAFAYAVSLYQHHISTFLILLSIYLLIRYKNIWSLAVIWFLCAASLSIDYPNFFLMLPIGIFAFGRVVSHKKSNEFTTIGINTKALLSLFTIIIPLTFFFWTNFKSYNHPFQLAGTIQGVSKIDEKGLPVIEEEVEVTSIGQAAESGKEEKTAIGFFKTRDMIRGLNIHFFSPDRGMIIYSPVLIIGILGALFLLQKKPKISSLLFMIIGINILLYSMWGDPWGGWAFGSRYLIPSYAILSIFLAYILDKHKDYILFMFLFSLISFYSIAINALGAITTNRIPPREEAKALEEISEKQERYMFDRNWEHLNTYGSKSFVFNSGIKQYLDAKQYYYFLLILISTFYSATLVQLVRSEKREKK